MAFNWRDFATGALEQASEELDTRGAEAKAYKERERQAAIRNAGVVQTRQARAQQAAAYGKQALQLMEGVPNAMNIVQTAMASGMSSISELVTKLDAAANAPGQGGKLGVDDIEAIISMPNIPTTVYDQFVDVSLQEFADRSYGAKLMQPAAAPADDMGIVGKLFGFDDLNEAKRDLAKEQYGSGMTVAEINALAAGNEYQSLIPEATMTFRDIETYSATERDGFATDLTSIISDTLTSKKAERDSIIANMDLSPEEKKTQITELTRVEAQRTIERKIESYNERGLADNALNDPITQRMIIDTMGAEYLFKLQIQYGVKDQAEVDAAKAALEAKREKERKAAEEEERAKASTPEAIAEKLRVAEEANDINTLLELSEKSVPGAPTREDLIDRFGPGPFRVAMERVERIKKMAAGTFVVGEDDTPTEASIRADIAAGKNDTPEGREELFDEYGPGPITEMLRKIEREIAEGLLADEY
tara:strand:+ start:123 stop:1550 length:1428 start_codon:yes stop_codon:yes gene_type:complete